MAMQSSLDFWKNMHLNVSCTTGLNICIVLRLIQFTICPDWGRTGLHFSWGKSCWQKKSIKINGHPRWGRANYISQCVFGDCPCALEWSPLPPHSRYMLPFRKAIKIWLFHKPFGSRWVESSFGCFYYCVDCQFVFCISYLRYSLLQ